jgi:hypothetical protein
VIDAEVLGNLGLQIPGLQHLNHDIMTSDKLTLYIKLWDGRPIGKLFDSLTDRRIRKYVKA